MIISSSKVKKTDLEGVKYEGDNLIFNHCEEITPILQKNYEERKNYDKGFKRNRGMKKVATIPALLFFSKPEIQKDQNELRKFLNGPEGELFKTIDGRV